MKVLVRVLLFLLLLCLLCGAAALGSLFVSIPWLSAFVGGLLGGEPWMKIVLSVVLLCFMAGCVLAAILALTLPTRRKLFITKGEAGKIVVSRKSIEDAAGHSIEHIYNAKRYYVRAKGKLRPRRLKLALQVEPRNSGMDLPQLCAEVQEQVKKDMAESLGMNPKRIKVKVEPVYYQTQEGEHQQHVKVPRVV